MPKERLTDACKYMKTISGVSANAVDQVFQDSLRLDSKANLNELLKVKVGLFPAKRKGHGCVPPNSKERQGLGGTLRVPVLRAL
jgi:hypothetical protein